MYRRELTLMPRGRPLGMAAGAFALAAGPRCGRRRYLTVISMFPFTTSIDSTGSPSPIVVSPKRGPN